MYSSSTPTVCKFNILLKNITKRQHQWLIVLLLFVYTVHGSVPKFMSVSMNYVSWFSVLYFIAAYLRLYPFKENNTKFWGWVTLLSFGLSSVGILLLNYVQVISGMEAKVQYSYMLVQDSNAFLALTNGITSFMWFKSINIRNSKLVNTIAASSFGVLLIHANSNTMRQWLWQDTVDCVGHFERSVLEYGKREVTKCNEKNPTGGNAMSRIFCKFCGTEYTTDVAKCPLCGASNVPPVADDFSFLDQAMTMHHNELLPLAVVPVLTLGNTGL